MVQRDIVILYDDLAQMLDVTPGWMYLYALLSFSFLCCSNCWLHWLIVISATVEIHQSILEGNGQIHCFCLCWDARGRGSRNVRTINWNPVAIAKLQFESNWKLCLTAVISWHALLVHCIIFRGIIVNIDTFCLLQWWPWNALRCQQNGSHHAHALLAR